MQTKKAIGGKLNDLLSQERRSAIAEHVYPVTAAIIRGQVLSKNECEEVVEDSLMAQLEEKENRVLS